MDNDNKRVVLITGATGGLGSAMCEALFKEGYRVLANYRNKEKAAIWKTGMDAKGVEVDLFHGEVSDYASVETMVSEIENTIGPIDILVNNAGITRDTAFRKMSYEQWRDVLASNLDSVFNCSRHVINGMIDRNWGRIINISSVNGQRGQFGQANYSAAKAGMHGFTKTLAMEVARKGITVNTISPGYIGTDMVMAVKEEIRNQIVEQIPMGRLGGTEEVAHLVCFLASDQASFITGANYSINGGQHVY